MGYTEMHHNSTVLLKMHHRIFLFCFVFQLLILFWYVLNTHPTTAQGHSYCNTACRVCVDNSDRVPAHLLVGLGNALTKPSRKAVLGQALTHQSTQTAVQCKPGKEDGILSPYSQNGLEGKTQRTV